MSGTHGTHSVAGSLANYDQTDCVTDQRDDLRGFPAHVERVARWCSWGYWAVWMSVLAYIWLNNPGLHHGDSFSDANVLNAGRNFDRWGLKLNYGLSTHFGTVSLDHPVPPYTHYPPGPEWILQGLKALSLRELWQFRAVSVCVSALALLCAWHVFFRLTGSAVVAGLAIFFYSWSAPFSQLADSVHQHAYIQLTLFGVLGAWLAYAHAKNALSRLLWLVLVALGFGADLWLTFEHILFIPVFCGFQVLVTRQWRNWRGLIVVGAVPAVALALRLWHNSLALGSFETAFADLFGAARYRAGFTEQASTFSKLVDVWSLRLGLISAPEQYDSEFWYPILRAAIGIPALMLLTLLLATWHESEQLPIRRASGYALILLVSGLAWWVAMKNHANHPHIVMLLLPGLGLFLGALAAAGLRQWWTDPQRAPRRWLGLVLTSALLFGFGWQMRSSVALNQLGELDSRVRKLVERRRSTERVVGKAGSALKADTARVYFVTQAPEAAYWLALPYSFFCASGDENPLPVSGKEYAIWIDYWSDLEKRLAWEALEKHGFPDMLSYPCDLTMVFRGRGTTRETVEISFENAIQVTAVRCAPAVDGDSWVIQALLEVPADPPARLDMLVHFVHAVDAGHNVIAKNDLGLQWAMRRDHRLLAVHRLRDEDMHRAAYLRVGLWSSELMRNLRVVNEVPVLPDGAEWSADSLCYIWRPRGSPLFSDPRGSAAPQGVQAEEQGAGAASCLPRCLRYLPVH